MKKFILVILLIVVLFIGYVYNNSGNNELNNNDKILDTDNNITDECSVDNNCIIIDDVKYEIKKLKEVIITDMYNYDNSQMEAGYLKIIDGKVVFQALDETIIKSFDNIDGKAKYIISSNDGCTDKYYAVITEEGNIYRNDEGSSLFQESPFYLVETSSFVKDALIIRNNDEYENCNSETLVLVLLDNSFIKMEK